MPEYLSELTMDGERFLIREAGLADYEDVLTINDKVYDGLDYLPAHYREFAQDPNRKMFVLENDRKLIAFRMYVTCDGRMLSSGARIHSSYAGRGLWKMFERKVEQDILACSYKIWLCLFNKENYANRMTAGKAKVVDQWNYLVIRSSREELMKIDESNIRVLPPSTAANTLCNENNWPHLFAQTNYEVVVGHRWEPCRVTQHNMRHVISKLVPVLADVPSSDSTMNNKHDIINCHTNTNDNCTTNNTTNSTDATINKSSNTTTTDTTDTTNITNITNTTNTTNTTTNPAATTTTIKPLSNDNTTSHHVVEAITMYDTIPLLTEADGVVSSVMYYGSSDQAILVRHLLACYRTLGSACPPDGPVTVFTHLQRDTDVESVAKKLSKVFQFERLDNQKQLFSADAVAFMARDVPL